MLLKDKRFWLAFLVFQAGFGALVFAITRAYYRPEPPPAVAAALPAAEPMDAASWRPAIAPEMVASLTTDGTDVDDPATLSHLADQYFANKDYAQAADYYARLLAFDPDNADLRNNLGLTLQYTGRTNEALAQLAESVARHPEHQRSWLTLGFVNRQAGDVAAAREALNTAVGLDPGSDVGLAAQRMLDSL